MAEETASYEGVDMSIESIASIDYVVLPCRDLHRSRRFYAEVMGFPVTYERSNWIKFQVGPTALALRPEEGAFRHRRIEGAPVQLAFRVGHDGVDVCYRQLETRGVAIMDPPTDQSWGHRTMYFADPDGNILEIYADIPSDSQS